MREYRGKRIDNGEWVYGSLISDRYIVGEVVEWTEDYFNTEWWCSVDPDTVGQYTGLQDKNGRQIFEGDRFKKGESTGTIVYEKDGYEIKWDDPNPEYWSETLKYHAANGEVIGNRWDHPHLLGEDSK